MRNLLALLFLGVLFTNCGDDFDTSMTDPAEQLVEDKRLIAEYLAANNLQAEETASGIRYIIEEQGTGDFIESNSVLNVLFRGYYLDGTDFDRTGDCSPITLNVGAVIPGFAEGLQLFNIGGKGSLFVPSALAFGQSGSNSIQPNTILAFDLEVVDLKLFERAKMKDFFIENELISEIDSTLSGIYYVIEEEGTGENPVSNSTVTVNYRGYFADGTTFDQSNDPVTFNLNGVIAGWQEVVPLLKEGGKGIFAIPSNLAYGAQGNNAIPSNTLLFFDIELVSFN